MPKGRNYLNKMLLRLVAEYNYKDSYISTLKVNNPYLGLDDSI